jgi:hypothetical protein
MNRERYDEDEHPTTSPLQGFRNSLTFPRITNTLRSFRPFIEPIAKFVGTFRNFFPYKITIPSENPEGTENVLLLSPQAPTPSEPDHRGPDLIFIVHTHGETCTEACEITGKVLATEKTIEGMNITLFERVPCGVVNLSHKSADTRLLTILHRLVDSDIRVSDHFLQILQKNLREWVEMVDLNPKFLTGERIPDTMTRAELTAYKKEKGWNIVGKQTREGFTYLERNYGYSIGATDGLTLVEVLYAKPGSPFTKGTNLLKSNVIITRSDLFQIAKGAGHSRIVVLDTSCGSFPIYSKLNAAKSAELTSHYKALGFAGGKRKRKHIRKTRRKNGKIPKFSDY